MDENDIYFETEDFKERKIICTKVQWHDHILKHHPYMDGSEDDVVDALRNPHNGQRCYDRGHKTRAGNRRRVYYKYFETWDEFLKVIVQFENKECNGIGYVWTAYQVDEITKGERPEL